jgi:hypothetical protein
MGCIVVESLTFKNILNACSNENYTSFLMAYETMERSATMECTATMECIVAIIKEIAR